MRPGPLPDYKILDIGDIYNIHIYIYCFDQHISDNAPENDSKVDEYVDPCLVRGHSPPHPCPRQGGRLDIFYFNV